MQTDYEQRLIYSQTNWNCELLQKCQKNGPVEIDATVTCKEFADSEILRVWTRRKYFSSDLSI
jgi:hypothetical protein